MRGKGSGANMVYTRAPLWAALVLSLAGCSPAEQSSSVQVTGISNGGSEIDRVKNFTIAQGTTVRVGFAYSVNPDCTAQAGVSAQILRAPANGEVTIEPGKDVMTVPPGRAFSACNGKTVNGIVTAYSPHAGFAGNDSFAFQSFLPDGESYRNEVNVFVH